MSPPVVNREDAGMDLPEDQPLLVTSMVRVTLAIPACGGSLDRARPILQHRSHLGSSVTELVMEYLHTCLSDMHQ